MVLFLKIFFFLLMLRNTFPYEESDFQNKELERRQLFWGSNNKSKTPAKSNAGDKSSPTIKKPVPTGSVINNVRQGVQLSKEGTYSTVIPKFTALSNKTTSAAIDQYFNSTKKISNSYVNITKRNVSSAGLIPKKIIKLNNTTITKKDSAPKSDSSIKLQGGTYSTIKTRNSTLTTSNTTTARGSKVNSKRRFRHRV